MPKNPGVFMHFRLITSYRLRVLHVEQLIQLFKAWFRKDIFCRWFSMVGKPEWGGEGVPKNQEITQNSKGGLHMAWA